MGVILCAQGHRVIPNALSSHHCILYILEQPMGATSGNHRVTVLPNNLQVSLFLGLFAFLSIYGPEGSLTPTSANSTGPG